MVLNRFAALEKLNVSKGICRSWEYSKENIRISDKDSLGLYELRKHKTWFGEEFSQFLGRRKLLKMRWLQDPNKSSVDNLKSVRREATGHFRNKKKEYLKAKIGELESNRLKISETCLGASVTLRRITSLELI